MPVEDMEGFDEKLYLDSNPDVAAAVAAEHYTSGVSHYLERGFKENRYSIGGELAAVANFQIERLMLSPRGHVFLSGWCNDFASPILEVWLSWGPYRARLDHKEVFRYRRDDVEEAFELSALKQSHDYGMFTLFRLERPELVRGGVNITIVTDTGVTSEIFACSMTTEEALCLHSLTFINSLRFNGDHLYHLFRIFEAGFADSVRKVYADKNVSHQHYTINAFNEKKVRCSVITVLFGMHSPIRMIGSTAISAAGAEFEWIFANNSPELAHDVLQAARIVSGLYDASVKVINFNGNVGFGLANNVAAKHAVGEIICIYNPDIIPVEKLAFDEILKCEGESLQGALLYYADGTIMHNGMNFYVDRLFPGRSIDTGPPFYPAVRVEHLDKGAPARFSDRDRNGDLAALSGALMVCSKEAFMSIGGFAEKFIFGHYEDANLCLRWREKFGVGSVRVNYQIKFVHLESKGSHGDKEPYRGAAKLNRWLFSLDPSVLASAIE
ncbi:hypothetical protein MKK69_07900 [Methylobacterium sp. J-026]|uniref:galactosyltransferase-related protein n=1 Tax=Methylobacterium sp. J-026 TaxID=2836624 RepID=UPI001FB8EAAF|nr:galactosyltransferase-related protein [Methylobacterium sp. J-026]MCJ2133988.1 hypothetical protein [Methylobacterium sp. J-026]